MEDSAEREEGFPDEDVRASMDNARLQSEHRLDELPPATRKQMDELRKRALAEGASPSIAWIYFESPDWTWQNECGRAGWLLYDPESGKQHEFLMELMN